MLLSPPEEKAIVRWIFKLDEWGFPHRLAHVKEAIALLKYGPESMETYHEIGAYYISRFLDRHPKVVAKINTSMEADRMKANDLQVIQAHFSRVKKVYPLNI